MPNDIEILRNEASDEHAVRLLKAALASKEPCVVELLNERGTTVLITSKVLQKCVIKYAAVSGD